MTELLQSWNDTPTRAATTDFVTTVTTEGSPQFAAPDTRIATFDNDGTLWCEKPMPIQLDFTLHRLAELADADASLRTEQPYQAAYEKDFAWLAGAMVKHYQGDDGDMMLLVGAIPKAFAGATVEAYVESVADFFETATHPTLKRAYRACGYQPMLELLRYLEANDFTVYIASGGDRDFMRAVAKAIYGIPPERVIGSSMTLDYQETDQGTDVLFKAEMEFMDDGPEKPIRIWSRIGRRPLIAVGNSNGDVPMLRFARTPNRDALRLLLLHDDNEREFDYTDGADAALARANDKGWTVISIKNDWNTVFADV
jgi:phosphoserine phosphatase